jgi:hypothetical protein
VGVVVEGSPEYTPSFLEYLFPSFRSRIRLIPSSNALLIFNALIQLNTRAKFIDLGLGRRCLTFFLSSSAVAVMLTFTLVLVLSSNLISSRTPVRICFYLSLG